MLKLEKNSFKRLGRLCLIFIWGLFTAISGFLSAAAVLQDAARGMMAGLYVGDAWGVPVEFWPGRIPDVFCSGKAYEKHVVDYRNHDVKYQSAPWTYSDDTALAIAKIFAYKKLPAMTTDFNANVAAFQNEFLPYCAKYIFEGWAASPGFYCKDGKDIQTIFSSGPLTHAGFKKAKGLGTGSAFTHVVDDFVTNKPQADWANKDSKSNGALMCMAPSVIYAQRYHPNNVAYVAEVAIRATHADPAVAQCGILFAELLEGASKTDMTQVGDMKAFKDACFKIIEDSTFGTLEVQKLKKLVQRLKDRPTLKDMHDLYWASPADANFTTTPDTAAAGKLLTPPQYALGAEGSCSEFLGVVLYAIACMQSNKPEEIIHQLQMAVSLGWDTDTNAAGVGQFMGALFGFRQLQQTLKDSYLQFDILNLWGMQRILGATTDLVIGGTTVLDSAFNPTPGMAGVNQDLALKAGPQNITGQGVVCGQVNIFDAQDSTSVAGLVGSSISNSVWSHLTMPQMLDYMKTVQVPRGRNNTFLAQAVVPLCMACHKKPVNGQHLYCGRTCAGKAQAAGGALPARPMCSQCRKFPVFIDEKGKYSNYCSNSCKNQAKGAPAAPALAPARVPARVHFAPAPAAPVVPVVPVAPSPAPAPTPGSDPAPDPKEDSSWNKKDTALAFSLTGLALLTYLKWAEIKAWLQDKFMGTEAKVRPRANQRREQPSARAGNLRVDKCITCHKTSAKLFCSVACKEIARTRKSAGMCITCGSAKAMDKSRYCSKECRKLATRFKAPFHVPKS